MNRTISDLRFIIEHDGQRHVAVRGTMVDLADVLAIAEEQARGLEEDGYTAEAYQEEIEDLENAVASLERELADRDEAAALEKEREASAMLAAIKLNVAEELRAAGIYPALERPPEGVGGDQDTWMFRGFD